MTSLFSAAENLKCIKMDLLAVQKECRHMLMLRFKIIGYPITFILVTLTALAACAKDQSRIIPSAGTGGSYVYGDLIEQINATHAAISERVAKKTLPEQTETRANALKFELEKYLILTDARLKIFKMEILQAPNNDGEAALQELVQLVSERERVKLDYLRRFKTLMGESDAEKPVFDASNPAQQTGSSDTHTMETGQAGMEPKTKALDIEIEIVPEDISKGKHD